MSVGRIDRAKRGDYRVGPSYSYELDPAPADPALPWCVKLAGRILTSHSTE